MTTGISEQGTLADMPRDTRNILVELYLGVVLLLTGLSSGQLAGEEQSDAQLECVQVHSHSLGH